MTKKEQARTALKQQYVDDLTPLLDTTTDAQQKCVLRILIDKIAYLTVYLEELQKDTLKTGVVVKYDNGGGQTGLRIHPAAQGYTQYSKTLNAALKQLQSFLPADTSTPDALTDFLGTHTVTKKK